MQDAYHRGLKYEGWRILNQTKVDPSADLPPTLSFIVVLKAILRGGDFNMLMRQYNV